MKIGDRVAIFWENSSVKDEMLYYGTTWLFGTVNKKYELKEDYSTHGSPWYPEVIEAIGDDGKIYSSFYHYYFWKIDDLIKEFNKNIKTMEHNLNKILLVKNT
jgi:hypothetical protein